MSISYHNKNSYPQAIFNINLIKNIFYRGYPLPVGNFVQTFHNNQLHLDLTFSIIYFRVFITLMKDTKILTGKAFEGIITTQLCVN
jgi:hypothetical protein